MTLIFTIQLGIGAMLVLIFMAMTLLLALSLVLIWLEKLAWKITDIGRVLNIEKQLTWEERNIIKTLLKKYK